MKSFRTALRSGLALASKRQSPGLLAFASSAVASKAAAPVPLWALARANFSTQAESELVTRLEAQIAEEMGMAKKNLEGREAPTVPGFSISTDEAEVKLTKDGVIVTFNVNHSVDADGGAAAEDGAAAAAATEGGEYMMSRPSFTVEVAGEGGQKLVFECQQTSGEEEAAEGEEMDAFTIDEVYVYSGELSEKVYATSGPIIDESLYDGLMDYLEERGIDGKFVDALTELATHYEHAQYVALLKRLKDFVQK